jgi:hypothetical protein
MYFAYKILYKYTFFKNETKYNGRIKETEQKFDCFNVVHIYLYLYIIV